MDAKEFLLIVQKECDGNTCDKCAFHRACIHTSVGIGYKEIVEEAIKRAEKLNHRRTYADDFFEKNPEASKEENGTPKVCREYVYKAENPACGSGEGVCYQCWNEPFPEKEDK